jgi:NADPH2:quinone reductase
MRALQITELTGPDGMQVRDIPAPEPDGNGVLIDVEAAGVAFPDVLMTRGLYQYKPDPPFTPGAEVAGTVKDAPESTGLKPGDRVMAFSMGGFQEQVLAPYFTVFKVPDSLSIEQAAGFPMNYHTVHFSLFRRGHMQPGETVLVHGAAGGVGTATLQVAKAGGAKTIAVVSSDEKETVARKAGADEVVRSDGDWRGDVKEITGGRGVDIVMDPVGGDRFLDSVRSLAPEGRLLVVGFTEGNIPSIAVNRLLLRNVSVVGVAWGAFVLDKPDLCAEIGADLERMTNDGYTKTVIDRVYPFDEGADAVRRIDERGVLGKVVIKF